MNIAWLVFLWSGVSFVVALQARRLVGRVSARHQLAVGFVLHAVAALTMLGAVGAGSWPRLVPGLVVSGVGSGLLNAALPLLAVSTSSGDPGRGTDVAMAVSAGFAVLAAVSVLLLRERRS